MGFGKYSELQCRGVPGTESPSKCDVIILRDVTSQGGSERLGTKRRKGENVSKCLELSQVILSHLKTTNMFTPFGNLLTVVKFS